MDSEAETVEVKILTEVFAVVEGGEILLQYPWPMTAASFAEFKAWMEIEVRKLERWTQRNRPAPPAAEEGEGR